MSQTPTSYQPYTPGRPGPEERPDRPGSSYCGAPNGLVVASIVCVVVWAMSGFGYFWPVWVILPTLLFGLGPTGRKDRLGRKIEAAASVSGHLRRRDRS